MSHLNLKEIYRSVVFISLFFSFIFASANPAYYNKHVIIVVDQSPTVQTHQNMPKLYDALVDFFNGKKPQGLTSNSQIPANFNFNPDTDEISLFASSLRGSGINPIDDYKRIMNSCRFNQFEKGEVGKEIVNALIHPRASYQSTGLTLTSFLDQYLKPMMSHNDPLLRQLPSNGSIGLNPFLYPLVLLKINKDIKSQEYYILIISSFYSQGQIQNIRESQLFPLCYNRKNYIADFDALVTNANKPFYERNPFRLQIDIDTNASAPEKNNNPLLVGRILGLNCLEGVGVTVFSPPTFSQKSYNSSDFEMSGSEVRFNHDNQVAVEKVEMMISSDKLANPITIPLINNENEAKKAFQLASSGNFYRFDKQTLSLSNSINIGDTLNYDYIFYARIQDGNNELVPYIFKADGRHVFSTKDIVPNPADSKFWRNIVILVIFLLAILCGLLYRLWKKRGLNRMAFVNFEIRPVSNTRFMEVRNKKVINEDCWYMGANNQTQTISVKGHLCLENKVFCKKYNYRLEYWISDADSEEDFTFRPAGKDEQGRDLQVEKWYRVDVNPDTGEFSLRILTYLDLAHSPSLKDRQALQELFNDPDHLNRILQLQLRFRILVLGSKNNTKVLQIPTPEQPKPYAKRVYPDDIEEEVVRKKYEFEKLYSFVVKPDFDRRDAWIAFDPGTTGSCAAFAFPGHHAWEQKAVTLAQNQYTRTDTEEGQKLTDNIFPSIIKITDRSRCFNVKDEIITDVEDWTIGVNDDFIFGNMAAQRVGKNRFQSIKKLLGYTTLQEIKKEDAKNSKVITKKIAGKDLAHLLVKGLYQEVGNYAMNNPNVDRELRKNLSEDGKFAPQRAIVAVPNNYTLTKIQEMVDSVKRLGCFKEVHYLYESEGVMMRYLNKMWAKLEEKSKKLFIVYDMGGATINATAFTLDVNIDNSSKSPSRVKVNTIAKIGYCVGGDDIDFALIRIIYGMPSIKKLFIDDESISLNMQQNKQKLIRFVTRLKLDLIDLSKGKTENLQVYNNFEDFCNQISTLMNDCGKTIDPSGFGFDDKLYLEDQLDRQFNEGRIMYQYVYSKVEDAVHELLTDLDKQEVELIFSGRSSLYPHIQDAVRNTIKKSGFTKFSSWDGFNDSQGYLDADAVKTAVAQGACWFGLFNDIIRLEHDVITSSFGYIDQLAGKGKFVPVIRRTEKFVEGKKTNSVVPIDKNIKNIRFVQMLGSDYDKILNDFYEGESRNKHKLNLLDVVPATIVDGFVTQISITFDDKNNFTYDVETDSQDITPANNRYSQLNPDTSVQTEIKDENNESYIYAAITSTDEKFIEYDDNSFRRGNTSISRSSDTRADSSTSYTYNFESRRNNSHGGL